MKTEKEIRETLKMLVNKWCEFDDKLLPVGFTVCMTCNKIVHSPEDGICEEDKHLNHILVSESYDHAGVYEWIRALLWVLGIPPTYENIRKLCDDNTVIK